MSDRDLDAEVEHAIHLASLVFSALVSHHQNIFPQKRQPWFMPNDDDVPK